MQLKDFPDASFILTSIRTKDYKNTVQVDKTILLCPEKSFFSVKVRDMLSFHFL